MNIQIQHNILKLGVVQMNVGAVKSYNLARAEHLVSALVATHMPHLVALPEMFDFAGDSENKRAQAEVLGEGATYKTLQAMARRHKIFIHGGSFHEWRDDVQRICNTTVVFNPKGEQVALYRKLHLFDITTPSGTAYHESASIAAGDEIVTYEAHGFTIGCAICYDLRFPELFQALRLNGADIIILPSAFTRETGKAHWNILLKARAIETQCVIAAPAQTGHFTQNGQQRFTHGHSAIIDAWGQELAQLDEKDGFACAEIARKHIEDVRMRMPVMTHRRFEWPKVSS